MASVWDVYNEHWGKESYKIIKRRVDTKKGMSATIHLLWCWMLRMPRDTDPAFHDTEELAFRLECLGVIDYDNTVRFKKIKEIAMQLAPPFVPELKDDIAFNTLDVVGCALERSPDTPWYHPPPVEKTLLKNLEGYKNEALNMHFARGYDSAKIRNLDAILAFP